MYLNTDLYIHPTIHDWLKGFPKKLESQLEVVRVEKGTIIHQRNYPIDFVCLIADGIFHVISEFKTGVLYNYKVLTAPSISGDLESLIDQDLAAATVRAYTDCTIIKMPVSTFVRWFEEDGHIARTICRIRVKHVYDEGKNKGENVIFASYYRLLILLARYFEKIPSRSKITLSKTRQELSEEIGVSVKTIQRNLLRLEEEGLLTKDKRKLVITKDQYKEISKILENIK